MNGGKQLVSNDDVVVFVGLNSSLDYFIHLHHHPDQPLKPLPHPVAEVADNRYDVRPEQSIAYGRKTSGTFAPDGSERISSSSTRASTKRDCLLRLCDGISPLLTMAVNLVVLIRMYAAPSGTVNQGDVPNPCFIHIYLRFWLVRRAAPREAGAAETYAARELVTASTCSCAKTQEVAWG